MKKLIINADDFGLSRSINKGIIELFEKGALTSTTLMVNMPGFDDALRLIRENPSLGVGVHINVMRGQPVSAASEVRSFCKGDFFRGSIINLLALAYTRKDALDQFAKESRAQIKKALAAGINITHLDSEKHIHIITPFFKVLCKVAGEFGISKIRCINETPYLGHDVGFYKKNFFAALFLSCSSKENKKLLLEDNFRSPDYFWGVSATGNMDLEKLTRVLSNLKEGTTEIMCHPGFIDQEWQSYPLNREKFYINAAREKEIGILQDPGIKGLFKQKDVSLISYREL